MPYALKLTRDTLVAGATRRLPPLNRVLYVLDGDVVATVDGTESRIARDTGWQSPRACTVAAGARGAIVLRYELLRGDSADTGTATGVTSTVLIEHPIDLDPAKPYLMRNDRVDFEVGGVALRHRHKGGGIRCLVLGTMDLRVDGHPDRMIDPGGAWFESGREPVFAAASPTEPTAFIRVSILPREIRGQSSIMYVDPADAARSKPRKYTVFVDVPIEI